MDLQDIKRRIFKDEDGWNNYMNVTIEEMDWLVEQAEDAIELAEENQKLRNKKLQYSEKINLLMSGNSDLLIRVEKLQKQLDAKVMFVSNGMEEEHYALQEKVIRYEKALTEIKAKHYNDKTGDIVRKALEDC